MKQTNKQVKSTRPNPTNTVGAGFTDNNCLKPTLITLENWILAHTRLISILGLRGSGKSAIALQLIQQIQYEFDCIIWRSLRDAPPLQTLQTDLIKFLWQQQ